MFSDALDVWDHLCSDITFKTYSDERLASLYLNNPGDFPIHMLLKVFDVILDPRFRLEEITFKDLWGMFDYISTFRGQATGRRSSADAAMTGPSGPLTCPVPPLALSLVVDRMVEDRPSLGILAEDDNWRRAYEANVADFHAMSLVHSTWTPIARRALERRVVVPYYQIDSFLLSPLCGPWVREMAVYWTIDNGLEGATCSHVDLFGGLLVRLPGLQSLAFNTSLVWPSYERERHDVPPFRVGQCLKLMSDMLPNLENLWLRHYLGEARSIEIDAGYDSDGWSETEEVDITESLGVCNETRTLFNHLHELQSLKFLSISSWCVYRDPADFDPADIGRHPSLERVELREELFESVYRSDTRREVFSLSTLSCNGNSLRKIPPPALHGLESLRIYVWSVLDAEVMQSCCSLVRLELVTRDISLLPLAGKFPSSLEHLKIENSGMGNVLYSVFPRYPDESPEARDFCDLIRSLPRLRSFTLVDPGLLVDKDAADWLRSIISAPPGEREEYRAPSCRLIEHCKEHEIQLIVEITEEPLVIC